MLQSMRQSVKGTTAKVIIGLIVISFAFFGIQSILLDGGGSSIAEVNGEGVYPQELDQAVETLQRRLVAMFGNNIEPAMLDNDRLRPQALEDLINRKLMVQSAESMGLVISEPEIGAAVAGIEDFQVAGTFSPDLYKSVLSNAGYTPGAFKDLLKSDLLLNQVSGGLAASEFITPSELDLNARIIAEQRDFRYFTIPRDSFDQSLVVSDEDIESYYSTHLEKFRSLESVDLQYLDLRLDDFRQPVEEQAVLEAYELAIQNAEYQTQNRVSHILFEPDGDIDIEKRVSEAQKRLDSGEPFEKVARELSADVGSAEKGGDLGYSSGDTFPEAMEAAIAELDIDMVSGPVETPAGIHLIKVTERTRGEAASLEEMRAQLEETISAEEARVALVRAVESLKDLTFNSANLDEPAEELGLVVEGEDGVVRGEPEGIFSNPLLQEAAFSDEVLVSGNNSEVIELSGERFIVLRVKKHNPSEIMPLESVRAEIVEAVADEAVRAMVAAKATASLEKLRSGATMEQIASAQGYEVKTELGIERSNDTVPADVLRQVFELPVPADSLASFDFRAAPNGDAIVVELYRVSPGDYSSMPAAEQAELEKLLIGEKGSQVYQEYQSGLRERADIVVL